MLGEETRSGKECRHLLAPHAPLQAVPSVRSSILPSSLYLRPPFAPAPTIPEHKAASVQSIDADNPGWGHIPGTSPDRPGGLATLPCPRD